MPHIKRDYAKYLRHCSDIDQRLRYFYDLIQKFDLKVAKASTLTQAEEDLALIHKASELPPKHFLQTLRRDTKDLQLKLTEQLEAYEKVERSLNEKLEYRVVLRMTEQMFAKDVPPSDTFSYLTGILEKADEHRFKRMIFRLTRGNALVLTSSDLQNLQAGKVCFMIVHSGDTYGTITSSLKHACDLIGAHRYNVPLNSKNLQVLINENEQSINSDEQVKLYTRSNIEAVLYGLVEPISSGGPSRIEILKMFLRKEEGIYNTMNQFKAKKEVFYSQCWIPINEEPKVRALLDNSSSTTGSKLGELMSIQLPETPPPTAFKLNEFTWPFQEFVNTYGVPNYQEVNPAYFTTITFPFLFGIMFGDVGHGLIMTAAASYLCLKSEELQNSRLAVALPARYMLLLMGLFATFCGLIYNEFLGLPIGLFTSAYSKSLNKVGQDGVYIFGIDTAWHHASNDLVFLNSFKMKVSVIVGITQMIGGVLLKGCNCLYFKRKAEFFFEFIPQLVFMICIFGYLQFMIMFKWTVDWDLAGESPSLIAVLMNMFLKLGSLSGEPVLWSASQETVQRGLLIVALACIPVMLFVKPIVNSRPHVGVHVAALGDDSSRSSVEIQHRHDLSEELIHQMIETIEFVLGSVSNTASYLRLWALSLAHAQLAKVFFNMCIAGPWASGNPIFILLGFGLYVLVTFGVLMMMDALECFLHALRLHWVEFMNKFFKGQGTLFAPFSFGPERLG